MHDVRSGLNKSSSIHKSSSVVSSTKTTTSYGRLREAGANAKKIELQAKLEAEKIDEELEIEEWKLTSKEHELASKRRQASQRKIILKIEAERQKSKLKNAAKKQESESSLWHPQKGHPSHNTSSLMKRCFTNIQISSPIKLKYQWQ